MTTGSPAPIPSGGTSAGAAKGASGPKAGTTPKGGGAKTAGPKGGGAKAGGPKASGGAKGGGGKGGRAGRVPGRAWFVPIGHPNAMIKETNE